MKLSFRVVALESVCRRYCNWHVGVSNVSSYHKEVNHVRAHRLLRAPPSPAGPALPIPLNHLWESLAVSQRQQLRSVLSELVTRRLLSVAQKEVTHEAR